MSRVVLAAAICLSVAWGTAGQSRLEAAKRISVQSYGFSVGAPIGWRVGTGKEGLPILVNFPWEKMQAQLRLPPGGAVINIIPWATLTRRKGDESLSGWAHLDSVVAAPGTVTSQTLDVQPSTEISEALLVSFNEATFGPDDQAQRSVSVYWTYRHERFAAHLSYLVGDPKGADYESVLRRLVSSVRPL